MKPAFKSEDKKEAENISGVQAQLQEHSFHSTEKKNKIKKVMDKLIFEPVLFIWQILTLLLLIITGVVVYKVVRRYLRS